MDANLDFVRTNYVVIGKGEAFWIVSLAIIGTMSIVNAIARSSYRLGKQDKEREIKKQLKKKFGKRIEL